ncbi:MAG: AzlD domain-containing protein [Anaerolineae bacterium]|nr:AzlD domain-containing protein [Anaerolineae bacterium]
MMRLWLILAGMILVTYSVRLSVIVLLRGAELPPGVARALRFVPPAALSAIVLPELIAPSGAIDLSAGNVRLIAGIAAALVAWTTRRTLLPIAVGMAALWLLQALT